MVKIEVKEWANDGSSCYGVKINDSVKIHGATKNQCALFLQGASLALEAAGQFYEVKNQEILTREANG